MKKLTRSQERVLEKAKHDPILIVDDGYRFQNGSSAHKRVVENLIQSGHLKHNPDGLFDGFSQTLGVV